MYKALGYHTFAKIIVVLAAYVLHFCLGKILTVEEYGIIGTIISFCNFYYMFLTNGVRQGISKCLAMDKYAPTQVIKKGVLFQTIFSLALALINFALAPVLTQMLGDDLFKEYLWLVSILIPFTAIYFAFAGGLNGLKLFWQEAIVIMVYPILRLTSVLLAKINPNDKPKMVILGFTLASLLAAVLAAGLLLSNRKVKEKKTGRETLPSKMMLNVSFEFIIFFAAITLVLNMDTFFLQTIFKDSALTGYYTGVHTFSLVPYYLISAFYLVMLPYITENYTKGDMGEVKKIIAKNFNIIMVFILPITALISATGAELLSCFYNEKYYAAGSSLSILCFGTFMLSCFAVLNVILNGINQRKLSKTLSIITVGLDVVLLYLLIPTAGLNGAALATTLSALFGCVVSICYIVKTIGNPFELKVIGKALLLVAVFVVICRAFFTFVTVDNLIILMGIYCIFAIAYLLCVIKLKLVDVKKMLTKK